MRDFMILIGQIFIISCIQILAEMFINPDDKPYQARILNIACFTGCLLLLVQFVFSKLLNELAMVMKFPF